MLVVEDDRDLVDLLTLHLEEIELSVDSASTGEEGLEKALNQRYDLIVLDLMLPGVDGLSICRRLRRQDHYTPILMVTARSQEMDKILGLELGADDYITKPFSPRELTARAKAILRRTRELSHSAGGHVGRRSIDAGELTIDVSKHRVFLRGEEVDLTAKEYDLLLQLASYPGQAFNREQLLDRVWHYQHEGYNHTVNSHINRLRSKIEDDPSHPRFILTVWGYGYRFAEAEEVERSEGGA